MGSQGNNHGPRASMVVVEFPDLHRKPTTPSKEFTHLIAPLTYLEKAGCYGRRANSSSGIWGGDVGKSLNLNPTP